MTLSCPLPTVSAPMLRLGCQEAWVLNNPFKEKDSLGRRRGWGGLPVLLWERKPKSCLWQPGILLAGIPGPAQGLSHGMGTEWRVNRRPGACPVRENAEGRLFLETRMGVLAEGMSV